MSRWAGPGTGRDEQQKQRDKAIFGYEWAGSSTRAWVSRASPLDCKGTRQTRDGDRAETARVGLVFVRGAGYKTDGCTSTAFPS